MSSAAFLGQSKGIGKVGMGYSQASLILLHFMMGSSGRKYIITSKVVEVVSRYTLSFIFSLPGRWNVFLLEYTDF